MLRPTLLLFLTVILFDEPSTAFYNVNPIHRGENLIRCENWCCLDPVRTVVVGTLLTASSFSSGGSDSQSQRNEFSRLVHPERVLKKRGGQRIAEYTIAIDATDEECTGLARRFDLSGISNLQATLLLRVDSQEGSASTSSGIEVEGTIKATLTQRCVRSNEDFEVNLQCPIFCLVRPVVPILSSLFMNTQQQLIDPPNSDNRRKGDSDGKKRRSKDPMQDKFIDEMDMIQLQRLLEKDISSDDEFLMEDESIYPLDGALDVGELTSQLFWLQLDPYPKKPGTDPVQRSITG